MRESAQVVIVGGGVAGCSLAYHLARLGCTDVLLVEKGELTSGSTWHAAGLCTQFNASRNVSRLLTYSIELYQELEKETGQAVDFHRVGSLRLASTVDRMDEYRRFRSMALSISLAAEILSPSDVRGRWPLINGTDLHGALWIPSDGYVDPSGVTHALATGARSTGVTTALHTRVTGLSQTADGGWVVETSNGPIVADVVVNAAGMWAPRVAAMAGVSVPITPVEHHMVVTGEVPELAQLADEIPVIRDPERSFYVRAELDGVIIGPFEKRSRVWAADGVPWDFEGQLLAPDLERIEPELEQATKRIPALAEAGLRRFVNGPDAYTPDGRCLMGWTPGVRNFFQLCGFSIFGIVSGGGAGKYAAEWIVHGQPSDDMWDLDVRRFGPWAAGEYASARALDVYGHEYAIGYPHQEWPAGRPVRTDPLYDRLGKRGAVMGMRGGWERPLWFAPCGTEQRDSLTFRTPNWVEPVADECRAVRERVGVLDQTSFAKFEVSGSGAHAFLDWLCCNRIPTDIGRVVVAPALTARGGVECDLTVTCLSRDRYYVVGAAAAETHDEEWLRRNAPVDGTVSIRNVTADVGVLTVAGPRSRDLLSTLTDTDLTPAAFRWMSARTISLAGVEVRALRVSYVGELGWELHVPISSLETVYDQILLTGEDYGLVDFGYRALDSLRIEVGYRLWGSDISAEFTPLEAGLDHFVKLDKGDFLGRDALLAKQAMGLGQRLATLTVDCEDAIPLGAEAIRVPGGAVVGYVSAAERGHCVGRVVAHAYLPIGLAVEGTSLEIDVLGTWRTAQVVNGPLRVRADDR